MSLRNRVKKLSGNKSDYEETIIRIMKYFHWNLEDVMSLSIPSFLSIVSLVSKIEKKDEDGRKRKSKRGR